MPLVLAFESRYFPCICIVLCRPRDDRRHPGLRCNRRRL